MSDQLQDGSVSRKGCPISKALVVSEACRICFHGNLDVEENVETVGPEVMAYLIENFGFVSERGERQEGQGIVNVVLSSLLRGGWVEAKEVGIIEGSRER